MGEELRSKLGNNYKNSSKIKLHFNVNAKKTHHSTEKALVNIYNIKKYKSIYKFVWEMPYKMLEVIITLRDNVSSFPKFGFESKR